MTRIGRYYRIFGLAASIIAITAALAPSHVPIELLRTLVFAQIVWTAISLVPDRERLAIISPLFLLAIVGLIFYAVLPLAYSTIETPRYAYPEQHARYLTYPGSRAEYLVLQFGSLCLYAASWIRPGDGIRETISGGWAGKTHRMVVTAALTLTAMCGVAFLADARWGISLDSVLWAVPPIGFFSLATALLFAKGAGRWAVIVVIAATLIFLAEFAALHLARLPMAFLGFAGLSVIATSKIHRKQIVAGVTIAAVAVPLIAIGAVSYRAHSNSGAALSLDTFTLQVERKILTRQAVSAWCFEQARKRHWNDTENRRYFGFVAGLVPRAVWPDKPNLSRGAEYAVKYCGARINSEKIHAEALTLLAEPVIQGGKYGIIVGEICLLVILGVASLLFFRTGVAGLATGIALLPWLTSFEQHMAFYVANCTKMFLAMLPFAIALHLFLRQVQKNPKLRPEQ